MEQSGISSGSKNEDHLMEKQKNTPSEKTTSTQPRGQTSNQKKEDKVLNLKKKAFNKIKDH